DGTATAEHFDLAVPPITNLPAGAAEELADTIGLTVVAPTFLRETDGGPAQPPGFLALRIGGRNLGWTHRNAVLLLDGKRLGAHGQRAAVRGHGEHAIGQLPGGGQGRAGADALIQQPI